MLTVSNYLLFILCFISYFQCIRIPNNIPTLVPKPRHRTQLRHNHPVYTEMNECHRDNNRYKPQRTSHCSRDGCVSRFVLQL